MPNPGYAHVNPFHPRSLPPPPPHQKLTLWERVTALFGSTKSRAKKQFLRACRLFNTGRFNEADAAFDEVTFQALPDPHSVQLRIAFYQAFCAAFAGNYHMALQRIEFVCQNQPHNDAANALAGRLYYVLNRHDRAYEFLQRAGQTAGVQSALRVVEREYAADLARTGRLDQALDLLRWNRDLRSDFSHWIAHIHTLKAYHAYRASQYGRVISEYKAAVQHTVSSSNLRSIHALARLALLQKSIVRLNLSQARDHLTAASGDLPSEFTPRLKELGTNVERIAYALGKKRFLNKDYAGAVEFLSASANSPFALPRTPVLLALALYWSDTPESAQQALASSPPATLRLPEAQYLAAYLAQQQGELFESYRLLTDLYQANPQFPGIGPMLAVASCTLAISLLATESEQAIDLFRFARQLAPSPQIDRALAEALYVTGTEALTREKPGEACPYLEEALTFDGAPSKTRACLGLAHLWRARMAAQADDTPEALEHVEACLSVWMGHDWGDERVRESLLQDGFDPDTLSDVDAGWISQAVAYYAALRLRWVGDGAGDLSPALEEVDECLRFARSLQPASPSAQFLAGAMAYILDNDWQTASDELSLAQEAGLSSPGLWRMVAAASFGVEEYERAATAYEALHIEPDANDPQLASYLAYCLWKTGKPDRAVGTLALWGDQPETQPSVRFLYGYLLYTTGQVQEAAAVLEPLYVPSPLELAAPEIWPVVAYEAGIELARADKLDAAVDRLTQAAQSPDLAAPSQRALAAVEHHRAIDALQAGVLDDARTYAEASVEMDIGRQADVNVIMSLAQFGQAIVHLNEGKAEVSRETLDEVQARFEEAELDEEVPWEAYVALARGAAMLSDPTTAAEAGEWLERAYSTLPGFAPAAALWGTFQWYTQSDVDNALAVWQTGVESADRAPILWRLLAMGLMEQGRHAEAAEAYASYREMVDNAFPLALWYQALCLVLDDRPNEALALLPRDEQLGPRQSFLRGYIRFRAQAWPDASSDLARAAASDAVPRAPRFAAVAACQLANQELARGNLAAADRALSQALRLSDVEIRPIAQRAQSRLRRQRGVTLLHQGQLAEGLKLLEAAVEQGVDDEETQVALAVARFGLARSNGAVQDMEAAAEILREHLPAISAARVLAATGGQQLKDASAAAVQHRRNHVSVERVRTTVTPLLRTAADMLSEALLLDGTQFSIHYLLGLLAYRLLGDVELAFVHLHEAQRLAPSDWSLPDRILGEISLQADQIFLAKRLLFNSWRSGQGSERLSDMLRSVMNREEELLNRFSQEREDTSEPGIDEVEDIVMRARMLNQVIAQVIEALPPDRQDRVRDLALQLKRALLETEHAKLEELENALLSELGPLLLKES